MEWALPAAGVTAAVLLGMLAVFTVGVALGYALILVSLPFVLWRWLLVFGAGAAAVGYVLAGSAGSAGTADKIAAAAQQQALEYGIVGLGVGFMVESLVTLGSRMHPCPCGSGRRYAACCRNSGRS